MPNTLTLSPSGTNGCTLDKNPWTPTHGADVTITNSSGYRQTLSNITNGCIGEHTDYSGLHSSASLEFVLAWALLQHCGARLN